MAKVEVTSEQFQHFLNELQDQFLGDVIKHTTTGLKKSGCLVRTRAR
jgi:hypothetical protein